MRIITLTQGKIASVDTKYHKELVSQGSWYYSCPKPGGDGYALRNRKATDGAGPSKVYLHQEVLRLAGVDTSGCEIDHRDRDKLNNRRRNLRVSTSSNNKMNRGARSDSRTGFKGVFNRGSKQRPFQAYINVDGHRTYLGQYVTAVEAARAYNKAAKQLFGNFACLNNLKDAA